MKNFAADRLKLLRENLTLTQAELGDKLGVNPKTIGDNERGKFTISYETIVQLVNLYNVNPAYFFIKDAPMFLSGKTNSQEKAKQLSGLFVLSSDETEVILKLIELIKHPEAREILKGLNIK